MSGVSSITVHRDLARLSLQGVLERIHGGARLRSDASAQTGWRRRLSRCDAQKRAIAEVAVDLVAPDSTIFVDSSTTCLAFAEALARRPGVSVSIVTNSPAIAYRLESPSVHVVVVPGELNLELRLIAGSWATEFLSKLHFKHAFVSGSGITATHGLGSMTRPLADVLRAAVSFSDETIALVDSSKFDHPSLVSVAGLGELTRVITDDGLAQPVEQRYRDAGARLVVAEVERSDWSAET
jgi:DeoR/GlpR family transcriptional regulator of sugar metabolism